MTPAQLDAALDRFTARLRARLAAGAATYGDASFTRPAPEIVNEVMQELEDVCGWSLLLWVRLDRVRRRVAAIHEKEESMAKCEVRVRSWVRGSDDDQRAGLIGFVSLFYGDVIIDGVTVRRTADGRLTLSWPERRDRQGRRHAYVRPIDDDARQRIEREIFGQAAQREDIAMEVRDG